MKERLFYSIVIPAHNEEGYLAETLEHVKALDYPQDRFEVLVIENGSTDATYAVAKRFEGGNLKAYSYTKKGVSVARNRGSELARTDADWVVFLDADTHVRPHFLRDLNDFMHARKIGRHAAGAMSIQPLSDRLGLQAFFRAANVARRFTKFPYACFLIRRNILDKIQSDEEQELGEDVRLFADACHYGPSFFFHTDCVHTSVRRFQGREWLRTVSWLSVMPLAGRAFHKMRYKVVR